MEWRKLKNIILIMLVVLNAALVVLVGGPQISAYSRQIQADREAMEFLRGKGIRLSEEIVPDSQATQPQIAQRDLETEETLARQLLGADAVREHQGGEVYRYTSQMGALQFHSDGSFWAELKQESFPMEGEAHTAAAEVLEKLGFSGEIVEEGNHTVTFCQNWEGATLFQQRATVVWGERGLSQISAGRRLYGTPVRDTGRESIDRATALVDFYNGLNRLGDVCSRVDSITPGYLSTTSLNKVMTLTPIWRVSTDTGAYQLDLVSGELERVA